MRGTAAHICQNLTRHTTAVVRTFVSSRVEHRGPEYMFRPAQAAAQMTESSLGLEPP